MTIKYSPGFDLISKIILLLMLLVLLLGFGYEIRNLQSQIDQLPKKVSHIEEVVEKYTVDNDEFQHDFGCDDSIICEDGVFTDNLCTLGYQTIWSWRSEEGKTCLITTKKEVCVIE